MEDVFDIPPCPTRSHYGEMWDPLKKRVIGRKFSLRMTFDKITYQYYESKVGTIYTIKFNGKYIGKARLENVRSICPISETSKQIRKQTFVDYTLEDYKELLRLYYGSEDYPLINIALIWTEVYRDEGEEEFKPTRKGKAQKRFFEWYDPSAIKG